MVKLDLIIVGAGGFGRELHAMLWDVFSPQEYRFKGFLANETNELAQRIGPVLGPPMTYAPQESDRFLLAIGHMDARARTTRAISQKGGRFVSYIHPTAIVANTATIGVGAVIYPYAVVSNSATLADQVHLNYFASVGHDVKVGRCCLLAPYATLNGFCVLEDFAYMSTHATVVVAKRVGTRSKISANSTVQHDVPPDSFVYGVPGHVLRKDRLG